MDDLELEAEITRPGRPTGQYLTGESNQLILQTVFYPEEPLPFDFGFLPKTLSVNGDPLQVILIEDISHPAGTRLRVRLLGGIQNGQDELWLIAAPVCDPHAIEYHSWEDLGEARQAALSHLLGFYPTTRQCLFDLEAIRPILKEASRRYQQAKAAGYHPVQQPAWKPADRTGRVTSYTEAEHYTAAEYTFFQLPHRFQHYITEYLANDERILYAVHRPMMRSQQHSWLRREKLNEGVLILTTQRLIQLTELAPLGSGNIRYGFQAQVGVLERLAQIAIEEQDEGLLLSTGWEASSGQGWLKWETPLYTRSAILELVSFLEGFAPNKVKPLAIQRAYLPEPEQLPALSDPSNDDPGQIQLIQQRFEAALPGALHPDETVFAWALWPGWYESKGYPRLLVVTQQRLLVLPDPQTSQAATLEIPFEQIATLEFAGSILTSYLGFNLIETGKQRYLRLGLPYPTKGAFLGCFEAIRQAMAINSPRAVQVENR